MSLLLLRNVVKRPLFMPLMVIAIILGCSRTSGDRQEVADILQQLDSTNSQGNRTEAVARLQRLGTNAFPLLIAEMNSFKWHTPQEKDQAVRDRTRRLREAFEVLGTNLIHLTNEFARNLDTNRNFVSAMDGFVEMGGAGVPYLLGALTNSQASIRLNAVAGVLKVGRTSPDTAKLAIPLLIPLLKDKSVLVRSLATETLGQYCANSSACIPVLLAVAQADSDEVVRCQALKAVGRIQTRVGPMPLSTRSVMEEISKQDKSRVVRGCAERILAQNNRYGSEQSDQYPKSEE